MTPSGTQARARRAEPRARGAPGPEVVETSHRENGAESYLAAHHALVGLARLLEWIRFDHGPHTGQLGETQRIVSGRWRSRGIALNALTPDNDLHGGNLDGIE